MLRGHARLAFAVAALLALAADARASDPPFPAAAQGLLDAPPRWLGAPGARVDIGATGLIVAAEGVRAVPLPAGGPTQLSPSSSPAWLAGDVSEWAAISFRENGELRTGAIGSRAPDWAGRGEIKALQFVVDDAGAVATGRLRDLKIKSEYALHPDVPGVQLTVILSNRSPGPITELTYAREWALPDGRVARAQWSLGSLQRRQSVGLSLWYVPAGVTPPGSEEASALDLPVTLWVHPDHPFGLQVGATNGLSWGDFDADGWPDLFAAAAGNLWRNVGGGNWSLAANLLPLMPKATIRYGASFGDYDADGFPDLVIEPRKVISGDTCLHLLHNEGGTGAYTNVSGTALDVQPCLADGETACWADVDGDGWLDLFFPAYPPWVLNGTDNWLFRNLGPGQSPMFENVSADAKIGVPPPDNARPEGAQFCDVDGDGDPDLYSNGALYQNVSAPGAPLFVPLPTSSSGIGYPTVMDEGTAFFDYDLDGDFDLVVAYADSAFGAKLFENRGDGTFVEGEAGIIIAPMLGAGLGISAEDWDGDGDVDFSTRQIFRRNMLLELGQRTFEVGFTPIPPAFVVSATPAWADWDRDGDLDMALGNYLEAGSFWTNTTLQPGADLSERRDLRVLVLDDAPGVPGGTETAYGASVEVRVVGEGASPVGGSLRRRKFVASSAGYLNQSEYALSFFLPPDPEPSDPEADLVVQLTVDFPGAPGFAPGGTGGTLHRVDRHVNPALGNLALATLAEREIRVFRSGRVEIGEQSFAPAAHQPLKLQTTNGGLQLPGANSGTAPVIPAPTINRWVGVEVSTAAALWPVHVHEIILDGQLDATTACAVPPFNVALWDVTSTSAPVLAATGTTASASSPRNDRSFLPVDFTLQPGRRYRIVARITSSRFTAAAPSAVAPMSVVGGLNFRDDTPCTGSAVSHAPVFASRAYVALRWAEETHTTWTDLGGALAGSAGTPSLTGSGELSAGQSITLTVAGAKPFAPTWMILGVAAINLPFKGGTLVPAPLIAAGGLGTDATGGLAVIAPINATLPAGTNIVVQAWMLDAGGVQGAAATNGVRGTAP